jgi:hypothetical protein
MNSVELSLVIPVKDEEEAIDDCLARVIPIIEAMNDPRAIIRDIVRRRRQH